MRYYSQPKSRAIFLLHFEGITPFISEENKRLAYYNIQKPAFLSLSLSQWQYEHQRWEKNDAVFPKAINFTIVRF